MKRAITGAMAMLAVLAMAGPQAAQARDDGGAEKLRRLDIMLMVTGLRCRAAGADFTGDYGRFTGRHLALLNAANAELHARYAAAYGAAGGQAMLDRLSTRMANSYGEGHPWLTCAQLALVARNLARVDGRETLEEAADQLLASRPPARLALAGR